MFQRQTKLERKGKERKGASIVPDVLCREQKAFFSFSS